MKKVMSSSSDNSIESPCESLHTLTLTIGRDPLFASLSESPTRPTDPSSPHIDIQLEKKIGHGSYGTVFRAIKSLSGKFIAVKIIKVDMRSDTLENTISVLEKEISILRRFDNPNIVKYFGSEYFLPTHAHQGEVRIFMEYMAGGSLSSLIKQYGALSEPLIANFTRQIITGLHYLHSHGVVHRDLKGANILSDGDGNLKLADFGASRHIQGLPLMSENSELCKSIRGSLYWMAPEILKRERYGRKVDVWSLGCVIIEMVTGTHPWTGVNTYEELCLAVALQQKPVLPATMSQTLRDLVDVCLEYDKRLRPNTSRLLKHPFLNK